MTLDQFWINLIRKSPREKLASANEKRNSANHYLDSENQIVQMTAKRINTVFCYMDSVKQFFLSGMPTTGAENVSKQVYKLKIK